MNAVSHATLPEPRWVRRSFGAAAADYDAYADLQRAVALDLSAEWSGSVAPSAVVLDVGAGTGLGAAELRRRHPHGRLLLLDLSEAMLWVARRRLADGSGMAAAAEALPLATASVDVIFSSLAIQWCASPEIVFREFRRVLRPGGSILFSTLGAGTLWELREAWRAADGYTHVNDFRRPEEIQDALGRAGFAGISLRVRRRVLHYPDVAGLMRSLKGLGAHNVTAGRPRHLTGKGTLRRMLAAYPVVGGEGIAASFETILGTAHTGTP